MPKSARFTSTTIKEWTSKFPKGTFIRDGNIIYCNSCNQKVFKN